MAVSAPSITDTHCHLNLNSFQQDLAEIIERARQAGIVRILIPAIDLETSRSAVDLSERYDFLFAAVGVHPNDALTWDSGTRDELRQLAQHPKVVAIGEIGLDYYRDHSPRSTQMKVFREQLELALETHKPVILHNRSAMEDLWPIMQEWRQVLRDSDSELLQRPGVFHAFDGGFEIAQQIISEGFYLGVGGPVTFTNARDRHALTAKIPLDHVLLETDAPYLTPHPWRGRRNEPGYIPLICRKLSEIHGLHYDDVAQMTTQNANLLFGWGAGI